MVKYFRGFSSAIGNGASNILKEALSANQQSTPNSNSVSSGGGGTRQLTPEEQQNNQKAVTPNDYLKNFNPSLPKAGDVVRGLKGIIEQKQLYQQYSDALNAAQTNFANEKDASKKTQWQKQIETSQRGMDLAKENADIIRQLYDRVGTNIDALAGSGRTLDQAQSAYNIVRKNAIQGLLNSDQYRRTSQEFFDETYDRLRQNGKGDREATIIAGREATKYQADRVAFYEQAQYALGFDDDAHTKMNFIGQKMQSLSNNVAFGFLPPFLCAS